MQSLSHKHTPSLHLPKLTTPSSCQTRLGCLWAHQQVLHCCSMLLV